MESVLVILQVVLAAVLAVAAVGKAFDLPGARQAVRDFGVPERYSGVLGTALPVVEGALAIGLLVTPLIRWAAIGTLLLFGTFIGAIAWNLRQGRQPDCHCFGQIHSEPAGPSTLIRNSVLALATIPLIVTGGQSIPEWVQNLSDGETVALVLGAVMLAIGLGQLWFMQQLVAQNQRILERVEQLSGVTVAESPVEEDSKFPRTAPAFDVAALDGGRLSLASLLDRDKPILLLFVDPGCGPCRQLVPDMAEWSRRFRDEITIAWLSTRSVEENQEKFGEAGFGLVGIQPANEVYLEYGLRGTPSGVLIGTDGVIREPYATGGDRIRELLDGAVRGKDAAVARPAPVVSPDGEVDPASLLRLAEGPSLGTQGSRLPLPALDGSYVSIDDFRGGETVLLFIGAQCAFTQRMLPELKEWEAEAGDEEVGRVLAISMGSADENRELGLQIRVVLDDGFTVAGGYGATGTPAAIQLDADGKVASPLVTGSDAVLDLLWDRIEPIEGDLERTNGTVAIADDPEPVLPA